MKKNKLKWSLMLVALVGGNVFATTALAAVEQNYESNAVVEFVQDSAGQLPVDPNYPDPTDPVEPWDPTTPEEHNPNPGTNGPLSLDYASSIDFGKNKISPAAQTYYAEPQYLKLPDSNEKDPASARPNYVQVTDKRGTHGGWTLTVKQETDLTNNAATTVYKTLIGAEIKFTNGVPASLAGTVAPTATDMTLVAGVSKPVMSAKKGAGAGTWVNPWGTVETVKVDGADVKKNTAITLSIPANTKADAVQYSTKLTWTLTDVPGTDA